MNLGDLKNIFEKFRVPPGKMSILIDFFTIPDKPYSIHNKHSKTTSEYIFSLVQDNSAHCIYLILCSLAQKRRKMNWGLEIKKFEKLWILEIFQFSSKIIPIKIGWIRVKSRLFHQFLSFFLDSIAHYVEFILTMAKTSKNALFRTSRSFYRILYPSFQFLWSSNDEKWNENLKIKSLKILEF